MKNFDVILIGAGPGGYIAAIRAAQLSTSSLTRHTASSLAYTPPKTTQASITA